MFAEQSEEEQVRFCMMLDHPNCLYLLGAKTSLDNGGISLSPARSLPPSLSLSLFRSPGLSLSLARSLSRSARTSLDRGDDPNETLRYGGLENTKHSTLNHAPKTLCPIPDTSNPKIPHTQPQTPNPKHQTPNPKPRTPNP